MPFIFSHVLNGYEKIFFCLSKQAFFLKSRIFNDGAVVVAAPIVTIDAALDAAIVDVDVNLIDVAVVTAEIIVDAFAVVVFVTNVKFLRLCNGEMETVVTDAQHLFCFNCCLTYPAFAYPQALKPGELVANGRIISGFRLKVPCTTITSTLTTTAFGIVVTYDSNVAAAVVVSPNDINHQRLLFLWLKVCEEILKSRPP